MFWSQFGGLLQFGQGFLRASLTDKRQAQCMVKLGGIRALFQCGAQNAVGIALLPSGACKISQVQVCRRECGVQAERVAV